MYGCEGENQRTYGRTELERISACHCVRLVAIHSGEHLQPQYYSLCRHAGEYMCGLRHHLGAILRRGRYGGAYSGAEGNVFCLEFPFKRPEGSSEPTHSCYEVIRKFSGGPFIGSPIFNGGPSHIRLLPLQTLLPFPHFPRHRRR